MSIPASTAKYLELSSRTYELILDTLASATRRRLDYWKSVWEIVSRPRAVKGRSISPSSGLPRLEHQNAALETQRDSWSSIGSTMGQVGVAGKELSVDGGSTVDQSSNGRKTPANPVSVSN